MQMRYFLIVNYLDEKLGCVYGTRRYKFFMNNPHMMKEIKEISKKEYLDLPLFSK
ncbi:MAG: hypothetical protein ACLTDM_15220 [Clostridium butyricum]